VVPGDFDQPESLDAALTGVDAVFVMATPFIAGTDVEVRQASALVDAALNAKTGHIVYSSAAAADRNTGVPHFESKLKVEKHLRGTKASWTIVGPAGFFEVLTMPWTVPALLAGTYSQALPPDRLLQYIGVDDIGEFVTRVIEGRDEFFGSRIDLAADAVTPRQVAATLSRYVGRPIEYVEMPLAVARKTFGEDRAKMFEFFAGPGFGVDIDALKARYSDIGWQSLEAWAARQDWKKVLAQEAPPWG
jgi:uncharacterized protein YbjT (DUF2867 family)